MMAPLLPLPGLFMLARLLAFVFLLLPAVGLAWGDLGHQTVCEIAYQELNDNARTEVRRLIDQDAQYQTFAESCTWADGPPRQREFDHFMNFPRSTRAVTIAECALADTCLFSAIELDAGVLGDITAADPQRLEALKLLGHWVGDIHQPMHVSFADDRGANSVLAMVEQDGEVVETNLHAVWDSWIIEQRLGGDYRRLVDRLRARLTPAQRDSWRYDSPAEWANESFQIATSADARYCVAQSGACWYEEHNLLLSEGEEPRRVTIGANYAARHEATVERRLTQAGVRLGGLLNRLLASAE